MGKVTPVVRFIPARANVPIRISIMIGQQTQKRFIRTEILCSRKDITPDGKLKASFYSAPLENLLHTYRTRIAELGPKVRNYTAEDIKKHLLRMDETDGGKFIDFAAFCDKRNESIRELKGKNGTWYCNTAAIGWLKKFERSNRIDIKDVTHRKLELFEEYLIKKGVGKAGISCYMRALRTLFLSAMDEYNDDAREENYIKHYPFRKFKIREALPDKRSVDTQMFARIVSAPALTKREEIGRDMLFLSFLLGGIAPIDLYKLSPPSNGYIEYYRDKVKHRDKRIRVKIPICKEAEGIIKKYAQDGFLGGIKSRYACSHNFSKNCGLGLGKLCKKNKIEPISLYWARHTFASIAGELGYDSNLIDFVLGHAPSQARMAEVYITRKQKSVDELVKAVTNTVISELSAS